MSVIVASKNNKRVFNQEQITIGSDLNCDYVMSIGEKFLITLHYREEDHKCVIINSSCTKNFYIKMFLLENVQLFPVLLSLR